MFQVTMHTESAAFDEDEGNAGPELAQALRRLAERVEDGVADRDCASIHDSNGNRVGEWQYVQE